MTQLLPVFIVIAVALTACATDLTRHRIPNALTFGAALAALLYGGLVAGGSGVMTAIGGWCAGAAVFMPFFLLGGMGAGDVKLLAAIGAWIGVPDVLWAAVYTSIAGGVAAVVVALARGYLRTAFSNIGMMARYWMTVGPRPVAGLTLDSSTSIRLPYAFAIFIGTAVTLWLR
jgi:prepilin peptidase CpaA